MLLLFGHSAVFAKSNFISRVYEKYSSGNYEEAISHLDKMVKRLKKSSPRYKQLYGLISYWKGLNYARLNEYPLAERNFILALENDFYAENIYYEYGQVLYVSLKYKRARIAFKKSYELNFKKGVSLYYIASISKELKDYKKAVRYFRMIENLEESEKKDVAQAARTQVGDIYLTQVERGKDPYVGVKDYVIPQYKYALEWDDSSALSKEIRQKIEELQRRYEILLFRMRNGKPTSRPPHYVRADFEYGVNDNVPALSEDGKNEASISEDDYSSSYFYVGVFSRYSFYPNSSYSVAPELSAGYTQYQSKSENILPYNSYFVTTALKFNFEHEYEKKPATFYLDIDYTYNADDADADDSISAANNTYGMTLSEELQFFQGNPSTFRFRLESVAAVEDENKNSNYSFSYEQVWGFKFVTLFLYNNYRVTSYDTEEASDTNALTNRIDIIFPSLFIGMSPTLYMSRVGTNYINNSDRGSASLLSFGVNISRVLTKHWYGTFDLSSNNQTADTDSDTYSQMVYTFKLNYIF